jgi:uncharacterized damage-inducible protein DinB
MPGENDREREDLIEALAAHRRFLRQTVEGISDEQARERTTVSALCLGGIVKHVTQVEKRWVEFIVRGPEAMRFDESSMSNHAAGFQMLEGETLAALLGDYDAVAQNTEELVRSLPSLDVDHPLPEAPWFRPGARRSARRVFLHIIGETAQHAGHADIIREALDGAKTMG